MFATLSLSLACELFFGFMGRYGSRVFSCIFEPSKLDLSPPFYLSSLGSQFYLAARFNGESLRFIRMDAETCYEVAAARF